MNTYIKDKNLQKVSAKNTNHHTYFSSGNWRCGAYFIALALNKLGKGVNEESQRHKGKDPERSRPGKQSLLPEGLQAS